MTKLGALKVMDRALWIATIRLAFEEGRTVAEAMTWLEGRGYGPVSLRTMMYALEEVQAEVGSVRTERPPDPEPPPPWKVPCKGCKGFGHMDKHGRPSLKSGHAACEKCGGTGSVPGDGPRQTNGGRLVRGA